MHRINYLIGGIAIGALLASHGYIGHLHADELKAVELPSSPNSTIMRGGAMMVPLITFSNTAVDGRPVQVSIDASHDPVIVDTHGSKPDAAARAFWLAVSGVYPEICRR